MIIHFDNEYMSVGIEDEILYFTYKNGITIDLPIAIGTVAQRLSVQDGKSFPVLCNVGGVREISRLARIYLSKRGTVLVERIALVSTSKLSTTITEFYLLVNARSVRARLFSDENAALQFLRSF